MNQKRQWILTGTVTLCLLGVWLLPPAPAQAIKMAITQFLSPMLSVATQARQTALWRLKQTDSRSVSGQKSQEPMSSLEGMRERVLNIEEVERENQRLRELIGFASGSPGKKLAARVIGRDASNWWRTILLDRGTAQGVRENMAVLVPEGLVGKTIEVGPQVSRALLIVDPNCKVAALLDQNREPGIVEGIGASSETDPQCQMNFIRRDATAKKGDWVRSSGLGGVFPKGRVIGQVEAVGGTGFFLTARVKPSANLARLEEVLIVLGE